MHQEDFESRWNALGANSFQRDLLLTRWSTINPEAAFAFLLNEGATQAITDLLTFWAAQDPRAALTFFNEKREVFHRDAWFIENQLYQTALQFDSIAMIDIAISPKESIGVNDKHSLLDNAFEKWVIQDREMTGSCG